MWLNCSCTKNFSLAEVLSTNETWVQRSWSISKIWSSLKVFIKAESFILTWTFVIRKFFISWIFIKKWNLNTLKKKLGSHPNLPFQICPGLPNLLIWPGVSWFSNFSPGKNSPEFRSWFWGLSPDFCFFGRFDFSDILNQ